MNEIPDNFSVQPFPPETVYELRISGELENHAWTWFEDMTVDIDASSSPVQTIIRGPIRDEAALYGLIARVRDLGLTLLSVNRVEEEEN
jgi:hypothetical protein